MPADVVSMLLMDLVLILAGARVLGWLAERVGQPAVVGEIAAGILAGPTLLGSHLSSVVFPMDTRPALTALADIGIALFMFVAGTETDLVRLARTRSTVPAVSLATYLVPFVLGSVVALTVLSRYQSGNRIGFVLFVGCSLAVTAFPVLARILHDRDMVGTPVGQLALGCAAIGDVLAWVVLAGVIATTRGGPGQLWRSALLIPLAVGTWVLVRPVLQRMSGSRAEAALGPTAVCGALLYGAATEWAGLQLIFGAFLFGLAFPREAREKVRVVIGPLGALFMPCFFVIAGLRVDLSGTDRAGVVELLVVIVAAVGGKLGGAYLSARATGSDKASARMLAVLMNTRGLTELILLDVGLSAGIITAQLYSLLVVMALVTTALTAPLLGLLRLRARTSAAIGPDTAEPPPVPPAQRDTGSVSGAGGK